MILIVEMRVTGWIHEECNAGMITILSQACDDSQIMFFAEKGHIEAVKNVGIPKRIRCCEIDVPQNDVSEMKGYEREYENIWEQILQNISLKQVEQIYILASSKNIIQATVKVNLTHKIPTFFVTHINLETVIDEKKPYEEREEYEKIFTDSVACDFVHYIPYAPWAKKYLSHCLDENVCERFIPLNIPLQQNREISSPCREIPVVGVYGACVNDNFKYILRKLYDRGVLEKIKFKVMRRTSVHQLDCSYAFPKEGVELRQSVAGFTKEELEDFFAEVDWLLLPYDENRYRVSTSGILADAIQFGKPILGLNSPCINYYNNCRTIGIVEDSIENLCNRIAHLNLVSDEEYVEYICNEKEMQGEMETENIAILRGLYG